MTKKYCRSSLSEEACKEDSSCTRVNNHSYHPFSILVNGKYVDANEKNCTGEMHEEPYLMVYEDQCGLMPPVLYGNTSFGKHYDPANSSPDKNFGIFKDCWNCIRKVKDLTTDTDGRIKEAGSVSKQIATCMDLNEGKLSKYMESSATVINKKVSEKRGITAPKGANVTLARETTEYCCRDGPNGETFTFFKGDGKTSFNKQKYSPWGEEQAKAYCMSLAANEGKPADGLFYNRPCKSVKAIENMEIDACLDAASIENCI